MLKQRLKCKEVERKPKESKQLRDHINISRKIFIFSGWDNGRILCIYETILQRINYDMYN